jgi:2-haloacid dehalogenase
VRDAVPPPPTAPRVTGVVFDVGGVLVDWNPRHLYRKLFGGDEAAMERFLATVCTPQWNAGLDAGRPWSEAVAELVGRFPQHARLIRAYDQRWEEMLGGVIEGSVRVLHELERRRVPLYAVTNWSAEKWPIGVGRLPFLDVFDDVVVSGEVGAAKPDPDVYRVLLDRHGLDPSGIAVIDDVEANLEAAASLGFATRLFRSPEGLRADLVALGLLPAGG